MGELFHFHGCNLLVVIQTSLFYKRHKYLLIKRFMKFDTMYT